MRRVGYLDQAKAWGMFLVFYGHFLEALLRAGASAAFHQWKLIYSFHMPFFFFLTGTFWKPAPQVGAVLKDRIRSRLVPVLFFGLLLVPAWLAVRPPLAVAAALGRYASGKTDLNAITWFLVCLFVVEVLAALLTRYFRLGPVRLAAYAALAFAFGMLLVERAPAIAHYTGVAEGFWYIHEAVLALSFFLLGYLAREFVLSPERLPPWAGAAILLGAGGLLMSTYDLNQGPFPNRVLQGVVMAISSHGNPALFALSACAGIAFLLSLAWFGRRAFGWTEFVGRNSLIFLGLNGINLHFLDRWFVGRLGWLPATSFEVLALAGGYVLAVMAAFSLLAYALRRWLPELAGYPWQETSLLPPMAEWLKRGLGLRLARFSRQVLLK